MIAVGLAKRAEAVNPLMLTACSVAGIELTAVIAVAFFIVMMAECILVRTRAAQFTVTVLGTGSGYPNVMAVFCSGNVVGIGLLTPLAVAVNVRVLQSFPNHSITVFTVNTSIHYVSRYTASRLLRFGRQIVVFTFAVAGLVIGIERITPLAIAVHKAMDSGSGDDLYVNESAAYITVQ